MLLRRTRARYFTPAEATATLPALRAAATAARRSAQARQGLLDRLRGDRKMRPEDRRAAAREAEQRRGEVQLHLDEIAELGAEVVSLLPIRIAFPALLQGREVVLDWREGEPTVAHWHARLPHPPARQRVQDPTSPRWLWAH